MLSPQRLSEVRSLFPHTTAGTIYLNHAATSPLSTRVVAAMQAHLAERSAGSIETYPVDVKTVGACREAVARLIHAESADRIALVPNTSEGLNIVASGIPWRSGDRIILYDREFPANVHPYYHLRSRGVEMDFLSPPAGAVTPELIGKALTPRTRVVALSAVQFLSGYRADLAAIGSLCRSHSVLFVVDGIQAVGAVRIDVQAMKIDACAAGAQKWLMSPHGTGFLYLTEALQNAIDQQHVGWLSVADPWKFFETDQPLAPSARRYEGGTLNHCGFAGMHAAVTTLLAVGGEEIETHILAITRRLQDGLRKIGRIRLLSPEGDTERAGIVTVSFSSGIDPAAVHRSLEERHVVASLREGYLRFSPHFYNTPEEIDRTLEAIQSLVRT